MSAFNIEEYLNSLPNDVEEIYVIDKRLTYLPDLSRFKNLKNTNEKAQVDLKIKDLNRNVNGFKFHLDYTIRKFQSDGRF